MTEQAIAARAASCGIALTREACAALAAHARAVLDANERLHLTTITDPGEFLERHLGEAFEGAAMLDASVSGVLLDVGSGNGYPALPLAAARAGLKPLLIEASEKKARFLSAVVAGSARVVFRQVQRASDVRDLADPVRVITMRAVGGWSRLVPKLAPLLEPNGSVLLWAGAEVERVRTRVAWRRLRLEARRPLPGKSQSSVWEFLLSS